jgi:hypothetical protein
MHEWMCVQLLTHECLVAPQGCIGSICSLHHSMRAISILLWEKDLVRFWGIIWTHGKWLISMSFFLWICLPSGPFQGNDWEQQPNGEKATRRILFKYEIMNKMFSFSLLPPTLFFQTFLQLFTLCVLITWIMEIHLCHFFRYVRFVLKPENCLNSKSKFLMAWKFGAPPTIMYTLKIEAN